MSFNAKKFQYICFSPHSSLPCNIYTRFDIINYSRNILDLGINVSSDCSFDFYISNFVKRTKYLTGWMLRTFSSRDKLTLFKELVMPRLDYSCQLWSPYLIKHINMVEKVQRYFTRIISGMKGLSYPERLTVLKLYSLQRRRERYIIIGVLKFLKGLVPNLFPPICTKASDCRGRTCITSHINVGRLGTLEYNSFRWRAICLYNQLHLFLRNSTVCSIHSFKKKQDFYISTVSDFFSTSQDSTTAWIMEIALDGGHPVMAKLTTRYTNIHTANIIFTNIILMADKHNIPKGKMHSNCRRLPEDIVCKITQKKHKKSKHL